MDIALADVNGDKREDLIAACGDIFLRHADGSLSQTPDIQLAPPPGEPKGWAFMAAADFDQDGWTDVALLANGPQGVTVWLYRNTRNPRRPFAKEPEREVRRAGRGRQSRRPQRGRLERRRRGRLDPVQAGRAARGVHPCRSPADGLSPRRVVSVRLDYVPHFDARFGAADFTGDGRLGLAGFGRGPTGAMGVYIWLQPKTERPAKIRQR